MSLIKADSAAALDRFRPAPLLVEEIAGTEPSPDPRLTALEAEVARLEGVLAAERVEARAAIAAAREDGAAEVLLDDGQRSAAVEAGVAEAVSLWRDRLAGLETLAVAIAHGALARMFDEHADTGVLVERTVRAHVARIGSEAVVAIRVSALDFPDGEGVDQLRARVGLSSGMVTAQADLSPGQCRIDLTLGRIDLDLDGQWLAVDQALRALVAPGASA